MMNAGTSTNRAEQYRRYLCREHGICSKPDCNQPIIGWQEKEWGSKLCEQHLSECERRGEDTYRPQRWAQDVEQAKALFSIE